MCFLTTYCANHATLPGVAPSSTTALGSY
jgi:hypothetical protein